MKKRHSVQTIMEHCCVVFCTIDWRYKDEHRERTGKNCIFISFLKTETKERVDQPLSTANLLNYYATPNQHCLPPWLCTNTRRDNIADSTHKSAFVGGVSNIFPRDAGATQWPQGRWCHPVAGGLAAGSTGTTSSINSSSNCSCSYSTRTPTTATTTTNNNNELHFYHYYCDNQ